ncbi:MAG: hypothetical protein IJL09_01235 [Lachnospiraceae bacterium]|nr:hypothetical protein [Lachnospiraceae bacterium]
MRKIMQVLALCLVLAFFAGCGKDGYAAPLAEGALEQAEANGGPTGENSITRHVEQAEVYHALTPSSKEVVSTAITAKLDEAGQVANEAPADAEPQGEAEEEVLEVVELTEQELRRLQWSIRGSDNGFFVCHYDRPEEIDWQTVLQYGAGMNVTLSDDQIAQIRETLRTERLEEERRKAEMRGEEPPEEDGEPKEEPFTEEELALNASKVTCLTLRSIQNFAKSRTGLDYSEARKPIEWKEIARNLFYYIHDEQNPMRVEFMSGTVCGTTYEIYWRRNVWAREKKPEYVIKFTYEKGKWNFISNLPVDQTAPKTLANIEFFTSRELARLSGASQFVDPAVIEEEEDYEEASSNSKKKQAKKDPVYYWAVITAAEDNTRLSIDRVYHKDEISKDLMKERIYIPGERIAYFELQAGEKIAVHVTLDDVPKLCVRAEQGSFYGDYAFGSENRLKRNTKEGMPLSTYVLGRDQDGEHRGVNFRNEKELIRFLEGTWLFYDSELGEYTATVRFDQDGTMRVETYGETYVLVISGYDRMYADIRSAPPDLIKLKSVDEETLELFKKYYSFLVRKVGDYRVRAVQMEGEQRLTLSLENSGKDGLSYLLPGANPLVDEIVLYRFIGTTDPAAEEESDKG